MANNRLIRLVRTKMHPGDVGFVTTLLALLGMFILGGLSESSFGIIRNPVVDIYGVGGCLAVMAIGLGLWLCYGSPLANRLIPGPDND